MKPNTLQLWRRFWAMAWPYWREGERVKAWGLLALLVILLLGQTRFAVLLNELTGEFTSALAARDEPRFWDAIRTCVLVVLAAVPIMALFYYVRDKLGIHWRRWLSDRFLDRYFSNRQFYALNANAGIDCHRSLGNLFSRRAHVPRGVVAGVPARPYAPEPMAASPPAHVDCE